MQQADRKLTGECTEVELPPESFWLSKDAEFDWFDRNAFLERKESTRGNFVANSNSSVNPSHSNPSSQRYSVTLKSKAPIIGLRKTQKTSYVDLKCRLQSVNVRLFPKQVNSVGKVSTNVPVMEPVSPKVSCIGRVRSKRCYTKRSTQATEPVKSQKTGLISRIMSVFRSKNQRGGSTVKSKTEKAKKPGERSGSRRMCVSVKPVNSEPGTPVEPAGLGGMNRFASGRRSEYWGGSENDDVSGCDSLDLEICESVGFEGWGK
ncbi:hypothetical protein QVD17_02839 [Tagetes erecta]|uniref:Uncharacterized protein n=1 Tax=Tagetes erecta TaxID=13708 RepID=A0AAD8L7A8_TARER|nr:hypothetical protein QVD17_02839 [Tagetes erecta]